MPYFTTGSSQAVSAVCLWLVSNRKLITPVSANITENVLNVLHCPQNYLRPATYTVAGVSLFHWLILICPWILFLLLIFVWLCTCWNSIYCLGISQLPTNFFILSWKATHIFSQIKSLSLSHFHFIPNTLCFIVNACLP